MAQQTTTLDILNVIRDGASAEYQNRVPVATQENLAKMGDLITSYTATKEEFMGAIVNKIAMTNIYTKSFKNKLSIFKKGEMPFGKTIENVFVEMVKAKGAFDGGDENTDGKMIFSKEKTTPKVEYIDSLRKDFYKATISDDQIRTAFLSQAPITTLATAIINAVYTGMEYDEYVLTKELLAKNPTAYHMVEVEEIKDGANNVHAVKDFVKSVKKISKSLTYMSTKYNAQGVKTKTDVSEQVLLINSDVMTEIDIELLMTAFHQGNANIEPTVIEVDDFGSLTDTYALLIDKDFLQIYDILKKPTSQENPVQLYTNHFVHVWQLYGRAHFMNAVQFKKKVVTP